MTPRCGTCLPPNPRPGRIFTGACAVCGIQGVEVYDDTPRSLPTGLSRKRWWAVWR